MTKRSGWTAAPPVLIVEVLTPPVNLIVSRRPRSGSPSRLGRRSACPARRARQRDQSASQARNLLIFHTLRQLSPSESVPMGMAAGYSGRAAGHPLPSVGHSRRAAGRPLPSASRSRKAAGHPLPSASRSRKAAGHPLPSAGRSRKAAGHPLPSVGHSRRAADRSRKAAEHPRMATAGQRATALERCAGQLRHCSRAAPHITISAATILRQVPQYPCYTQKGPPNNRRTRVGLASPNMLYPSGVQDSQGQRNETQHPS